MLNIPPLGTEDNHYFASMQLNLAPAQASGVLARKWLVQYHLIVAKAIASEKLRGFSWFLWRQAR